MKVVLERGIHIKFKEIPISIKILLFSSFLMNLGGFAVNTFLAVYLTYSLKLSAIQVGTILSVYLFSQRSLPILTGFIGDRTNHGLMIVIGYLFRGIGFLGFGIFQQYGFLILSAFLAGFGGALYTPSVGSVFASLPEKNRKYIFPLYNNSLNLGVILGPTFAGFFVSVKPNLPFIWGGLIFLIMVALVFFYRRQIKTHQSKQDLVTSLKEVCDNKPFLGFVGLCIIYWIIFQQLNVSLPIQMLKVGGSNAYVSLLLSLSGLFGILWMFLLKKQFERKHPFDLVKIGILVTGIALTFVPYFKSVGWIIFCTFVFMFGETLFFPSSKIATADFSKNRNTGVYFGIWEISWGIGGSLGNFLGTWLMDQWNSFSLSWAVYGLLGIIGFFVVHMIKEKFLNDAISIGDNSTH